ncbi:unnamed protein product, partial [Iphiclides podalirius]
MDARQIVDKRKSLVGKLIPYIGIVPTSMNYAGYPTPLVTGSTSKLASRRRLFVPFRPLVKVKSAVKRYLLSARRITRR